jgi:SAM-dependent methyltransferase
MKIEKHKASFWFWMLLWGVSFLSMIQNAIIIFLIAAFKKLQKPSIKFFKIFTLTAWKVGRSRLHYSSPFVDWLNPINHLGKVEAASSKVLSVFYNFNYKDGYFSYRGREFRSFWVQRMNNSRGVTNRKLIIIENLVAILKSIEKNDVSFVSLASGSAEAVLEAIAQVPEKNIQVTLIDSDPRAIAEAKKSVAAAGLTDKFTFLENNILMAIRNLQNVDVIEMAGFCDYLADDKLAKFFQMIKKSLAPNGYFVTCNIMPNPEKIFLDWVLLWPMYYRSDLRFQYILKEAGFTAPKMIVEPLEVHVIAVCDNQ